MDNNTSIHQGSHFKKIIKKGSWYFFASVITKILAILVLPISTRLLSKHDIGVLDTLESIRQLLPLFISLSLDEAYYRFYFNHNKSYNELKKYVSTYFWIIVGWGIFVVFISLIIGKLFLINIFEVSYYPYIPLTMIGPLLLQLDFLGKVYLKQKLKSEFVSISEVIVNVVFYSLFLFLLLVPKLGAESRIYAFFISDLLAFIIFSIVLLKDKLIGFIFSFKILVEGLSYSIYLILNQALVWITGLSDRLLIGILKNFSSTGIYSIGYKLGQSLTVFSESIFKVYKPIMLSMFVDNKENAIEKIKRFIPSYFFIMYWLSYCIAFFSREAIIILTEKNFHTAYKIVPIVVFAYLFQSIYKPFYNIISFYKKTWIFLIGSLIQASSNFILNLILIPIFDRIAAAWTTLFSYILLFAWLFIWSQKIEKIKIDWLKILNILLISLIPLVIYFLISSYLKINFFINIGLKLILVFLALLISYWMKLIELPNFSHSSS
jgi:O-antigen/teichoic acid export membrane protein